MTTMRRTTPATVAISMSAALVFTALTAAHAQSFIRGDADGDGVVSMHDASLVVDHLAGALDVPCGDAADANDDGSITAADVLRLVEAASGAGAPLPAPFPAAGADPTSDGLLCSGTGPIAAASADGITVEYDISTRGHRGSIDVDVWVTSPTPVRAVELAIDFDDQYIAQVHAAIPDALKGEGRHAGVTTTASGVVVSVLYGLDRAIPANERTLAFSLDFCAMGPTPVAGWDLPLLVSRSVLSLVGEAAAAQLPEQSVDVFVDFGLGAPGLYPPSCVAKPPAPDFFTCVTLADGSVRVEWENPIEYDAISVGRRGNSEVLPGDATSWVDPGGGADDNYIYEIAGGVDTPEYDMRWSERLRRAAPDPREAIAFLRGDVNQDGSMSTADAVAMIRWFYGDTADPLCRDAADVNDDGALNILDVVAIPDYIFRGPDPRFPAQVPQPFPAAGFDPTHDGEMPYADCASYEVTPPEPTADAVRVGQVDVQPGEEVLIPIHVTNSSPIQSVQLVVRYDPTRLQIVTGAEGLSYDETFFSPLIDQYYFNTQSGFFTWNRPHISLLDAFPEEGYFTLGIVGHVFNDDRFFIPPGEDTVVARVRARVSNDLTPGTILTVTPEDGPEGEGFGPFKLRNELSYDGEGRIATISPTTFEGHVAIVVEGDISFFIRGDANDDGLVDVSDPSFTLSHLFLGGRPPVCPDAADADDSGVLEITDAIATLGQLFLGQSGAIARPFPGPGIDAVPDFLPPCRAPSTEGD